MSLTSRRSQPPLALSVPLSRFTSRVGGGSAFYVRRLERSYGNQASSHFGATIELALLYFGSTGGYFSAAVGRQLAVTFCRARRHSILSGYLFIVFSQHGRRVFFGWSASGYYFFHSLAICPTWIS